MKTQRKKEKRETRSTMRCVREAFFLFIQDDKIQKNMTMALKPNNGGREKWDAGQIKKIWKC